MPIVTTRCVVLQTYPFGDTSKILRLMTREHGPRSALARGALRPRSRLSGVLEPFAEGWATLYLKPNRDLHTISGFELVRDRQTLGRDLDRFAGASVLCELVMRLAPEHADPSLYRALTRGLDALLGASPGAAAPLALARAWRLVGILGFAPSLERCVACGRPIAADEGGAFDLAAGGLRCRRCSVEGELLPPAEVAALRRLAAGGATGVASRRQAALLADFIRYHMAEGVRLRSLEFLGPGRLSG